jgi:starch synthase (maltosyl-transferring)
VRSIPLSHHRLSQVRGFPFSAGANYFLRASNNQEVDLSNSGESKKAPTGPPRTILPAFPTRVIIDNVEPEIDGGRFATKRVAGEEVRVLANIYSDGQDLLGAALLYRPSAVKEWTEVPMTPLSNDRWTGSFEAGTAGEYVYTLQAWIDHFGSWRRDFTKKVEAGQEVSVDLLVGIELIEQAAKRATGKAQEQLAHWARNLRSLRETDLSEAVRQAVDEPRSVLVRQCADRRLATTYEKELPLVVDRVAARFSAWYEMFPRSASPEHGRHGTFRDCEARLPYVAGMGFDVLYFPPIHPIGLSYRKGKNNDPNCAPDEPGSPWAIGSKDGGHKAIHPQLGTLEDFRRLMVKAQELGLEIALDIAFHCTPDHPYVKQHPEWFRWRPDGSVQYAENPPKKYQDIYPFEFENENWKELWEELKSVVMFWAEQGVRIFRVDNPHTKPFAFWEWLIKEIKAQYPETIFLAEAFTRPNVMYGLAKLGFTQSYTYFAWRNTKWELVQYFTELTQTAVRDFFRPNLWPNTPDILTEYLQFGGRPAFMARLVLAATLGASYGIYGPAFELCENRPLAPGSEEYWDSEKYEIRTWDIDRRDSLKDLLTRVNRIRRENPALHSDGSLRFHPVDNDQLIAYTKVNRERTNAILVIVNLDSQNTQSGWVELPLADLGLDPHQPYQVHDELIDARFLWQGARNYVELNPHVVPAHIFVIRRRVRTERDFDYYL